MSLGSIVLWIGIYLITAGVFGTAAFGYFAGWWDDASLVAIALMTLTGFLVGRLTKTDYFIRRLMFQLDKTHQQQYASQGQTKPDKDSEQGDIVFSSSHGSRDLCVFHDGKHLRRVRNALYTLSEVDRQECRCWKCGSASRNLKWFPYDPKFHQQGCPIPGARLLVAPIDIADEDEMVAKN